MDEPLPDADAAMTAQSSSHNSIDEANVDALRSLLRDQEAQIAMLRDELDATNRGVVALYAELDDQAAQVRRSERRFLAIYEHAPCGIALLDNAGGLVAANPALERMLGIRSEALLGQALRAFADPEWSEALDGVSRPEAGTIVRREVSMRLPDGGSARVEWSSAADIEEGISLALAMDVSQRAELEALRAQWLERERSARGDAERGSREKDDFISVLAHELRAPLNVIAGWAQVFKRTAPDGMSRGVGAIERACSTQARLIADLLDMSRLRLGKLAMTFSEIDPAAEVAHALDALRSTAEQAGVALDLVVEDAPARIDADAARLHQVVWNLASNAIKFTPRNGRVRIDLANGSRGGGLRIVVSDSGQGMPADFLPRVFERFSQSDAGTNRQRGGLGLGLSIVKQIVEAHGGSISAASPGPGLGSTFVVELPLSQTGKEAGAGASADASAAPLAGVDVLVVDDDDDASAVMATVLEDRGATVRAARDADSAFALIAARRPDALVSDIGMPGKDGYALIRDIRTLEAAQRAPRLPAIALTAFTRDEDRRDAFAAGFDAHFGKPMRPLEIVRQIALLARP